MMIAAFFAERSDAHTVSMLLHKMLYANRDSSEQVAGEEQGTTVKCGATARSYNPASSCSVVVPSMHSLESY